MDLFIKIGVEDEASDKISKIAGSVGNGLKAAAKIGGAAVVAAGTAVAAMAKQAVDAYANYEQLVGGVETLFSNLDGTVSSASVVLENASNAYKTAGMSANQYMETVTSFSAALVSSLKNDYEEAARVSNMAITDMSDNANKMGTSMEAIQNAYQGFAKQNYTMLDNLKLGYGGTKSEMERLLADAEKITGVKYDINNLSDVYEAIHAVQTELGITGTTAAEAEKTISGSMGMLKASWQNLLTGLGDSNADLSSLFNNVVTSAETAFNNIVPVVEQALVGIGDLITRVAPIIADKLPAVVEQLIPPLISAATSLISALIVALPDIIGVLIAQLPAILSQLWDAIKQLGGKLSEVFSELFSAAGKKIKSSSLAKAFTDAADKVKAAWESVKTFFSNIWTGIVEAVSPMIDSVVNAFQSGWNLIQTIWNLPEIQALWQGIVTAAQSAWEVIQTVWEAAKNFFNDLWDAIVETAVAVWQRVNDAASVAWSAIQTIWNAATGFFQAVWDSIAAIFDAVSAVLQGDFQGAYDAIKGIVNTWAEYFKGVWDDIKSVFSDALDLGSKIVDDILGGIKSGWDSLKGWVSSAWDAIKSIFTVEVKMPGGGWFGRRNAIGNDYVPYNDYPALLHRGEAVLTAREADEWRRGGSSQNAQPIQLTVETPVEMDGQIVAKKIYKFLLNEGEYHGASLINA